MTPCVGRQAIVQKMVMCINLGIHTNLLPLFTPYIHDRPLMAGSNIRVIKDKTVNAFLTDISTHHPYAPAL